MCGIVGAVAERNVTPILLEGLRRLEYRGYDSAGIAVIDNKACLERVRRVGKVQSLSDSLDQSPITGQTGVAHTRWATHGAPSESNAHPHICDDSVAVVHNGIIENHGELREQQKAEGFRFTSETDTEVAVHQIEHYLREKGDLLEAVRHAVTDFEGAYALGVVSVKDPHRLIASRSGSPLVIGIGLGEHFIASDASALLPVTRRFIYLEEGDFADIRPDSLVIYDKQGSVVDRPVRESDLSADSTSKAGYRHYMLKEIHEQPASLIEVLEGRIVDGRILDSTFGPGAGEILDQVKQVQIIACGTSYHAGMVARYWLEEVGIPCQVEVASEFRYRKSVVQPDTLFVTISQSGETADTLAALRASKQAGYIGSLAVCNVPESSLVRESEVALMTRAGPEIGVASTKAFTTQLVALRLMTLALARRRGLTSEQETEWVEELQALPRQVEVVLKLSDAIEEMAQSFADKQNALFLGRGTFYPIAMEGALKLKEISYIHAEAYPAGELKHGPLALVDDRMPVVCALPDDPLLEKVLSNLQEVRARGGELFLFSDKTVKISLDHYQNLTLDDICPGTAPIVYTIPLQLLSYHVALLKGTDVDQPRNLAKSVTVE